MSRPPIRDLLPTACQVTKRIHGSVHQPTAALIALLLPMVLDELPASIAEEVVEAAVREALAVGKAVFGGPVDPTAAAILTVATLQPRVEAAIAVRLDNEERADREAVAAEIERRVNEEAFAVRVERAAAELAAKAKAEAEVEPGVSAPAADPLDDLPPSADDHLTPAADPLDEEARPAEVEPAGAAKPKRPRKSPPATE